MREPSKTLGRNTLVVVFLGLALIGCDSGLHELDVDGPDTTASHDDTLEYWMRAQLRYGVSEADISALKSTIEALAPGILVEFTRGDFDIELTSTNAAIPTECSSWALRSMWVEYDPDLHDAQAVADTIADFDVVVALTAPGIETDMPVLIEGEEAFTACEQKQLIVYFERESASHLDAVRSEAMESNNVVATAVNADAQDEEFIPDLSAYPEMEVCYGPQWLELRVIFDEVDPAGVDDLVARVEDMPGVIGVRGMHLETAEGDPVDRLLNPEAEADCGLIEGFVELDPDITDEEAAVVVARAKALLGVADVRLQLVDPASIEPCPEDDVSTDVHYDCFVPSSHLTIYRGDPLLADSKAVSDALLGLPGVLSVDVYDAGDDAEAYERDEGPDLEIDASGAAPTGGTQLPDFDGALPGDEGQGPAPLGTINTLPETVQLDFLFELCRGDPCFRDAHFLDPDHPELGSGPFTSDTPFHVRHGFPNHGNDPLGDGFDVVIYVTAIESGESRGETVGNGQTYRYTSDYVIQGTSVACGPNYRTQTGPVTCQWFVHEFNDGLPEGRHALWAFWEAPCSAWIEYGFTEACEDANELISLFSSGFDSPFGTFPPEYTETSARPRP